jgi:uracil-DNA glycosylase
MSTLTINTSIKTKNQPQESSGNSNVEITNTLKKKKIIAFEESVDWQVRKDLVLEKFPVVVKKKNDKHTLTVTVTYAPLDWINEKAQIVIVGITPGKVQARNAYRKAKDKLLEGLNLDQSLKEAKYEGSFSGGMRDRLVRALDLVGINSLFKISTSDELFKITCSLAHFTSLLPYPVFVGTSGYDGKFPISPTSTLFNKFHNYFLDEIPLVQDALFLPLGEVAHKRLKDLSNEGALDDRQVLPWLLHPSDQNINRYKYLLGETSAEKATGDTNTAKIDKIKTDLEEKVKQLKTVKSWHELPKNESPK